MPKITDPTLRWSSSRLALRFATSQPPMVNPPVIATGRSVDPYDQAVDAILDGDAVFLYRDEFTTYAGNCEQC